MVTYLGFGFRAKFLLALASATVLLACSNRTIESNGSNGQSLKNVTYSELTDSTIGGGSYLKVSSMSQTELDKKIYDYTLKALQGFVYGPSKDPYKIAKKGELRVLVDPTKGTTINQMSLAMVIAVMLDTGGKTVEINGEQVTPKTMFQQLENFHTRYLLTDSPLMSWSIDNKGVGQNGPGFVGEQTRAYALMLAAKRWPDKVTEYTAAAKETLNYIANKSMVTVQDGTKTRTILKAGEKWGSNEKGEVYCDFGGGQSPGLHKYFANLTGDSRWSENAENVYWILSNFNRLNVNKNSSGIKTGLFPNFMMTSGLRAFDEVREYYDELDSTVATFRIALDYFWNNEARAQKFLSNQVNWANKYYGTDKMTLAKSYHQFTLTGQPKPTEDGKLYTSATRALGFAVAAMANPTADGAQRILNEGVEVALNAPKSTSFHDLSAAMQLLIIQGRFLKP